jgi:hypothetical protein
MSWLLQRTAPALGGSKVVVGREPAALIWRALAWRAVLIGELAVLSLVVSSRRSDFLILLVPVGIEAVVRAISLLPFGRWLRGPMYRGDERRDGFSARQWIVLAGTQVLVAWCFAARDLPPWWAFLGVVAGTVVAALAYEAVVP